MILYLLGATILNLCHCSLKSILNLVLELFAIQYFASFLEGSDVVGELPIKEPCVFHIGFGLSFGHDDLERRVQYFVFDDVFFDLNFSFNLRPPFFNHYNYLINFIIIMWINSSI